MTIYTTHAANWIVAMMPEIMRRMLPFHTKYAEVDTGVLHGPDRASIDVYA